MKRILCSLSVCVLASISEAQTSESPIQKSLFYNNPSSTEYQNVKSPNIDRISDLDAVLSPGSKTVRLLGGSIINRVYFDAVLLKISISEPNLHRVIFKTLGNDFYSNIGQLIPENKRRRPSIDYMY